MVKTIVNVRRVPIEKLNAESIFDYKKIDSFSSRYLQTYYQKVDPDEEEIANFLVREYKKIKKNSNMIDVGCGPTIHHLLPIIPYVRRIDIADYLNENLNQIRLWIKKHKHSHKWNHFTKRVLELENQRTSLADIEMREDLLGKMIQNLIHCDVLKTHPIKLLKKYSVVGFFYCAEEVTTSKTIWKKIMKNVCNLVASGGYLYLSALRKTNYYSIVKHDGTYEKLPVANISEVDMQNVLKELDFDMGKTVIEIAQTPSQVHQGINGIILVSAKKN